MKTAFLNGVSDRVRRSNPRTPCGSGGPVLEQGDGVVAVHPGDEIDADAPGAGGLAGAGVGAVAEAPGVDGLENQSQNGQGFTP